MNVKGYIMKRKVICSRRGEHGIALILAIGMLAILSILGAVVLTVATRDLGGTATFLPGRNAFYVADRAVEFALNREIVMDLVPGQTIDLANNIKIDQSGNETPSSLNNKLIIESAGNGRLIAGRVTDLGPNDLPPSIAARFGSEFGANFYHVEVETESPGNAETKVSASIIRLFKSEDDTIFRTTGGG